MACNLDPGRVGVCCSPHSQEALLSHFHPLAFGLLRFHRSLALELSSGMAASWRALCCLTVIFSIFLTVSVAGRLVEKPLVLPGQQV